jgi:hypothetical protein
LQRRDLNSAVSATIATQTSSVERIFRSFSEVPQDEELLQCRSITAYSLEKTFEVMYYIEHQANEK